MFEAAYTHQLLNKVIDILTLNQFNSSFKFNSKATIVKDDLRKCVWLASILSNSKDEEHLKKVQLFSSLLFLQNPEDLDLIRASYLLFSRIGNLTATRFLKPLFDESETNVVNKQFKYNFGSTLDLEVAIERQNKIITISSNSYLTTKFQKHLWDDLNSKKNIAVSAPTSSGKSFIIKKFIHQQFEKNKNYIVLYIVPSKALINQVSEELRREFDINEIDVRTAYIIESSEYKIKTKQIYVLTPERCLRLLQYGWNSYLKLDLIFVDEIQNLEEEEGRGTLFEFVLKELAVLCKQAKIISAGPNIQNGKKLFYKIFGEDSAPSQTTISPVFQILTIVRPLDSNKIEITINSRRNIEQTYTIDTDFNLAKEFKTSMGRGLSQLVNLFGQHEQNIIYSPQPNLVQNWALLYAEKKSNSKLSVPKQIMELIDFLKEEIHPLYYLIKCLKGGIAFHHSKLPDIVRKEIEDAFSEGNIKDLFCTSTLMEGVNLPANNLFVLSPKKKNILLSNFEFGNLIGRAGRIKDSLYGTIYCVERNNEDWANGYLSSNYQKNVVTASEKSIWEKNEFMIYLDKPVKEISNTKSANTVVLLRQKFLRSPEELKNSLVAKEIDSAYINDIVNSLEKTLVDLKIPAEVLRLNPSIDPLLQNILYIQILSDGVNSWMIDTKKKRNIPKEQIISTPFKEKSLYWQLVDIMQRLDDIFEIREESKRKNSINISIKQMCFYALKWMENKSYGELIENDLNYWASVNLLNKNDETEVNSKINRLIKIYSNVVSFVFVKYLKLLMDIAESLMSEDEKQEYKFALALPTYLELGTSDPIVMQLISKGVSRSVAIKVYRIFKKTRFFNEEDVFSWLSKQNDLPLKSIYTRYLRRLKLIASIPPASDLAVVKI